MKKKIIISVAIMIILILLMFLIRTRQSVIDNRLIYIDTKKYHDKTIVGTYDLGEEVLNNPGKGWVQQNDINSASYISVIYERIDWADIETEEGVYNWDRIDEKLNATKNLGKKYAFGVMCANTASNLKYVSPEWIFKNGAQVREVELNYWYGNIKKVQMIPVWTDEIFLKKLNAFIKALGTRYNGNPDIAYIDIRSYGNWGEQHLSEIGR